MPKPDLSQLFGHVLRQGYEQSVRHYKGMIYTRVYNAEREDTKAWAPVCTIEHFVARSALEGVNLSHFNTFTSSPRVGLDVAEMIMAVPTEEMLPALVKDNTVYAFSNGVLFLVDPAHPNGKQRPQPRFHAFADGPVVPNVNACKYFDQAFDPAWLVMPWRDIPTVRYDKFGKDQGWNDVALNAYSGVDINRVQTTIPKADGSGEFEQISVFDVFFAFETGRIMFPLETFDAFQVAPMNLGRASTGKTAILQINKELFDRYDVGHIVPGGTSANLSMVDKRVVFAHGLNAHANTTDVLAPMISGECVAAAICQDMPCEPFQWTAPIVMDGCELVKEYSPALRRRLLIFPFSKQVNAICCSLKTEVIDHELPALLVKGVRAYFEFLRHAGDRGIWDDGVMPPFFTNVKEYLAERTTA